MSQEESYCFLALYDKQCPHNSTCIAWREGDCIILKAAQRFYQYGGVKNI